MRKMIPRVVFLLVFLHLTLPIARADAPSVTKVEPSSWWANHTIQPVRLLVRGRGFLGSRVRGLKPETSTSDVRVNSRGDYLFVNVRISPRARPGDYPLIVETPNGSARIPFRVEAPLDPRSNFRGINNDDVIYLIMTDRFADGDAVNNTPPGATPGALDRKNPRGFHGGDFRGIINRLGYLQDLGVTAIWLTPWYDNWNGVNNCDKPWCPTTYYHGYHAIDYYAVEDRFGDLQTLRELIEKAHELGIKVIQDQVANHVGSQHPWAINPPLDNWFHGSLQSHERNRFQNSVLLSPHANKGSVRNTLDGWFSDDLPDMNQEEPEVTRYEIQNSLWWVGVTGIDGIRQDTIQYMPRTFIRELSDALHRQYRNMWMVGEVFERDAAQTAFFIGGQKGWDGIDTHLDSVFDFSLWNASLDVFTNKKPVSALRDQLKYDALYPDASRLTVLSNNHDTRRFMSLQDSSFEGAKLHLAFIMTVRGIPQIYAGEEIAMEGEDDPDNRRDFPGGFPGDRRSAFLSIGRTSKEQQMWQWTRDWIKLRREHSSIRRGQLIDLFYDDDAYVYARQDASETVIVAINRSGSEKRITVPKGAITVPSGSRLVTLLGAQSEVTMTSELSFTVPSRTAIAYALR
ncbi:MAG TPA: alpha-amylase family glycosyl hydrolase [Pyrinomonadaceae bacterium]